MPRPNKDLAKVLAEKRLCCALHIDVRCSNCRAVLCKPCNKATGSHPGECIKVGCTHVWQTESYLFY